MTTCKICGKKANMPYHTCAKPSPLDEAIKWLRDKLDYREVGETKVLMTIDQAKLFLSAATERQALAQEVESLKRFKDGVIANAPACGACAAILFTGGTWPESGEHTCAIKERDTLHAQVEQLKPLQQIAQHAEDFLQGKTHGLQLRQALNDYYTPRKAIRAAMKQSNPTK